MELYLIYIGKVALAAGAFYLAFLLLFQNQKQFTFNRFYLPVSLAISFIIPLITFTSVHYIESLPAPDFSSFAYLPNSTENAETAFVFEWYHYLFGIYILGVIGFLFHLLLGHIKAISIVRQSCLKNIFNIKVNITQKDVHPFSFFNKIVLSKNTLSHPELEMIVSHENIHVKEKHTLDILFAEILFLFQWFNPFVWLLKNAMKNNLEYLTDQQIAEKYNAQAYQLAMVGLAHKKGVAPFLNALNGSQLKNRIIMMKKKTENKYAILKQLVVLPLLAVLVMGLSNKEVKTEVIQPEKEFKIVVDAKPVPADNPVLESIYSSKNFDGNKIAKTLGLKDKVVSNTLVIDEETQNLTYYFRTSDYILGTNLQFEKLTQNAISGQSESKTKKTFFAIDGKIISPEEAKKLDDYSFESATVLTAKNATEKYGKTAKNVSIIDFKTGESKVKVYSNTSTKEIVVTGKVTDKNGNPISGAAILIKGKPVGTISDKDGNYEIKLDDENKTLVFSMTGFEIKEINVNGKEKINVRLNTDTSAGEINITPVKSQQTAAEPQKKEEEPVYSKVDVLPQFPGGELALRKYIANSIKYPVIAAENGIHGKVFVTFIIDKKGRVKNPQIAGSVDPSLDKEALRVVNNLPLWKPGKIEGKPVNVSYTVPVIFELTNKLQRKYNKLGLDGKPLKKETKKSEGNSKINETTVVGYGTQIKPTVVDSHVKAANTVFLKNKINGENPLYIVDGKEVEVINNIDPTKIESISVLKDKSATAVYGEKGKNGVILITLKDSEKSSQNELPIVLNGKMTQLTLDEVDRDLIQNINRIEPKRAVEKYGEKGKNGVFEVTSRNVYTDKVKVQSSEENKPKANPLIVVDGIITGYKSIDNIDTENIESISVFKDERATEKYGEKGKNGVIEITLKQTKINSDLALRKFIAKNIKYPVLAQKANIEKTVHVAVKINNKGKITKISESETDLKNYKKADLMLDEVVVVAYKSKEVVVTGYASKIEADNAQKNNEQLLVEEAKRVLNKMPEIDIDKFKGKTVGVSVKFMLQD